jgi:regulator of protease activity HflC (stomatin/prohibitin superfamily)
MTAAALSHTQERKANTSNGGFMLLLTLVVLGLAVWALIQTITYDSGPMALLMALLVVTFIFMLFGNYKGTDRTPGLRRVLPWYTKKKISLRVRNVTGEKLKVNDKRGNPIEIAAVVVWRVTDSAQALFDVDHYQTFVDIQIETAVREIASHFAYDHAAEGEATLRGDADQVSALLREKLQERTSVAGVVVDETKLSHLAYAPEIAGAMLRRQQAEAVLAARRFIVQGAVEMVQHALEQLSERDIVKLDDERRAAMVSNLLVVLCGDRDAQPVVNTGSLYT